MNAATHMTQQPDASTGARLVATDGRTLPLAGTFLRADACAGLCRVVLEQRFVNPFAEPLTVTYLVPLPADGAVAGYAFRIGDLRVVGEIDRKARARERFEEAVIQGRTAALLEQERSSLFTQEVGNVPPGAEVVCALTIDQPLAWAGSAWEWRFPTVVAPRYMGAPGRVADIDKVTVDVGEKVDARAGMALTIRDTRTGAPFSPSHALRSDGDTVRLAESALLDRDVVVRWPVSLPDAHVEIDRARPVRGRTGSAFAALTLVPPALKTTSVARDLIVLLDTSGSMGGEPLDQARRVINALVDGLDERDRLEMIEFSTQPRRWKTGAAVADAGHKADARRWLAKLQASGSTEMRTAILEALAPMRAEAQRQVVLITDGLIGFESEIVREILERLPRGSRVHTVGVGSGINRSLTGPAARAGRGVEILCGLGEDVEPLVRRLLARTAAPLVVDLDVGGSAVRSIVPERLPDLFAGAPARLAVELSPQGGEIVVRGRTADGEWTQRLSVPPTLNGEGSPAVVALFGREAVEDLETRAATGQRVDEQVEALGLEFSISTRLTSWIAVSETVTVDPTQATRRVTQPHLLPHGMSAEGVGLRPSGFVANASITAAGGYAPGGPPFPVAAPAPMQASIPPAARGKTMAGVFGKGRAAPPPPARPAPSRSEGVAARRPTDAPPPAAQEEAESAAYDDEGDGFGADFDRASAPEPTAEKREAAKPAKKKSLLDRLRDALGGGRGREVKGRVVLKRDDLLVVEAALDGAWEPGAEVEIELADGQTVRATVDAGRSTAAGALPRGAVVRLTLQLAGPLGADPRRVHAGEVVITL